MYRAVGVALNDTAMTNGTMPLYGLVLLNEANYKASVVSTKELVAALCNSNNDTRIRNVSLTQDAAAAVKQGSAAFDKYLHSGNNPFKISDMAFDLLPKYSVNGKYLESSPSLVILAEVTSEYLVLDNNFRTTFIAPNKIVDLLKYNPNFIRNAYLKQGNVLVLKDRDSIPCVSADTPASTPDIAMDGVPKLSSSQGNACSLPLIIDEASKPYCVSIKSLHSQNSMNVLFIEDRNNDKFISALLNNANEAFNRVPGTHVTALTDGYKLSEGSRALRSLLTMKIVFLPKQKGHSLVAKVDALLKHGASHNVITQFAEYCNLLIVDYGNPNGLYLEYNPLTPTDLKVKHVSNIRFNAHKVPIMPVSHNSMDDIEYIVTFLTFGTLHEFADKYKSDEILQPANAEYMAKLRVKNDKTLVDFAAELCKLSVLILDKYTLPLLSNPVFSTTGDITVPAGLIASFNNMGTYVSRLVVLISAFYLAVRDNVYDKMDLRKLLSSHSFDFKHSCEAYVRSCGQPEASAAKFAGKQDLWLSPYDIARTIGKYWGYWES